MFDFDSAKSLRTEENERKPNLYVAKALWVGAFSQLLCLILNELGLFHVEKTIMRVCVVIGLVCSFIPQVIAANRKLSSDRRSKYVVLGCTCVMCFLFVMCLFPITTLLALLPMLLAVQYNSMRVSRIAVVGSCLCVAVAPPLGGVLGLWQSEYLRFLLSYALRGEVPAQVVAPTGVMAQGLLGVVAYVSFPWLLAVLLMAKLILSATQKGATGIENQEKVLRMNRVDALTGLYNAYVYDQYLKAPVGDESAGVLFFDVDGLKRANDEFGHEHGDLLLRRCAESLQPLFDENCHGFRIGGDEFLVVVETEDPQVLEEKLRQWRQAIERVNLENRSRHKGLFCHMSVGSAFGPKYDLSTLILRADSRMYGEKEAYHREVSPR